MNSISVSKVENIVRHIVKSNGYKLSDVVVEPGNRDEFGLYYTVTLSVLNNLSEKRFSKLEQKIERRLYRHSFTRHELFACVEVRVD